MNKYFKFLTAAFAVTALASCSDVLENDKKVSSQIPESDLVATLLPFDEGASTRVGIIPGGQVVWAEDDEVRVYSLDKLTFNSYVLDDNQAPGQGAGYPTAAMKENIMQDGTSADDYAVAQPQSSKAVRISASDNGNALLEAKIPNEYEWATVQDAGVAYKVPTQYWGKVTSTSPFTCQFNALTAFIKLDLKDLPVGTQSIMITTHEDFEIDGNNILGGANEPLSGVFEAELIDATSKLEASNDLNAQDYFRINFEASDVDTDKLLYIPVIAQTYQKLYVIAVTEYGKGKYDIEDGEILKIYENEEFKVNVAKTLALGAEIVYAGNNADELSALIAQNYDGTHTVRARVTAALAAGSTIYIANNTEKKNNVQITFEVDQPNALEIVEAPIETVGWMSNIDMAHATDATSDNGAKARTVSLIFEADNTGDFDILMPTSYVDINTAGDFDGAITILAAKSDASKPLSPARDIAVKKVAANDAKDAPITIHSSADVLTTFASVFVEAKSVASAIYVYNPETEITELGIGCRTPGDLRITDALVETIAYEDAIAGAAISVSNQTNVYTDGSAAIKDFTGGGNAVRLQADWTGKGLTQEAVTNDYDQADVYTAAQLQGLGLAAGTGVGTAVYEYKIADRVTDMWLGGSDYPWIGALMAKLWDGAGGTTFGAPKDPLEKLDQEIVIDGNHKALYNMYLSLDDPYFVDPHSCCTSCGTNDVKVEEDLGLVRGIYNENMSTIKGIRLNDVFLDTKNYRIPNVGSIAGTVNSEAGIVLDDNQTTNVRISNKGGNAGGHVGLATTDDAGLGNIQLSNSLVKIQKEETDVVETYVKTVGDNAGGFIGFAEANQGRVRAENNEVALDEVSADKGSNVGGIAGQLNYRKTNSYINTASVTIPTLKATELASEKTDATHLNVNSGNNVGGLVGYLWNDNNAAGASNVFLTRGAIAVKVADELTAANQYAGGLIGKLQMLHDGLNDDDNDKIELRVAWTAAADQVQDFDIEIGDLTATNGYAGGLVGRNVSGDVVIINDYALQTSTVDVTIGSLNTSFAGGGIVGENNDRVYISAENGDDHLNVTVTAWDNTWDEGNFDGYATMSSAVLNKLCGSFSHIIGHQNELFNIVNGHVNTGSGNATATVIPDDIKKALYFQKHTDATNTVGVNTDPFWGDFMGYVGFSNKTGSYLLNGATDHGDQYYNYRHAY